jgi:hypothetical protein
MTHERQMLASRARFKQEWVLRRALADVCESLSTPKRR